MRVSPMLTHGLLIAAAVSTAACATEDRPVDAASVQIPLIQPGPDGSMFRLRGASFEVTRFADGFTFTADAPDDDASLLLDLEAGIHEVRLLDGWILEQAIAGAGTFEPVPATLASLNPIGIRVVPNRQIGLSFRFFVIRSTGTLEVDFGVNTQPRQLSGGIRWQSGTGDLAVYANTSTDYQIYFEPWAQERINEDGGVRARKIYSSVNALAFYNDGPGLLGPIAETFAGGWVDLTLRVKPDPVQVDGIDEFEGSYSSSYFNDYELRFSPSIDAEVARDADGYPADGYFYAHGSTVELLEGNTVVLTGFLSSLRHFQ